ncbi:uncharacterized protein I303_103656 [Kwoniella dejecticola CBS 10117]|uniref:Uncharacterized protein n=1 Tax=Kwoniella dejecticola CBS 10117 TaxID=1296121 RepID=A0A1A6A7C7_9TREE|nr:uncharacterized protein I303_03677 [Kwoniella dejecticola CBS 10117]OBR85962.1 hypothetical protein I303_03677 [Kwoniella dejecticola CBS 10117]
MPRPPTSPQILTPVSDQSHDPPQLHINSDGEDKVISSHPPVSLLTALIQSSDHKPTKHHPQTSELMTSHSSTPSTAFSSPRAPGHGILQQAKSPENLAAQGGSILRRESNSGLSDEGHVGLGLGGMEALTSRLEKVEEKRERIGWADEVDHPPRTNALKFAVAPHPNHPGPESGFRPLSPPSDDELDGDIDDGYQEDEEDGFDSDDSQGSQIDPRFPFARPTNFGQHPRYIGGTRIPSQETAPAPALLPPPSRRGRGHVRVDEESTAQDKTCSRHRSPPPVRSRSSSGHRSSRPLPRSPTGRLSDAGPREGRAGSPMPGPISDESEDEAEHINGPEEIPEQARTLAAGWRSDDAVFYGPHAKQVNPIRRIRPRRHSSALDNSVFVDSEEEDKEGLQPSISGIGNFFRRASEHIPGFRRPSAGMDRVSSGGGSESIAHRASTPCPPALDNTPALAQNRFASDASDVSGGLTHRLETALATPSAPSSAAVSRNPSVVKRPETILNTAGSAQIAAKTSAQAIPTSKGEEQLGWTDEALLEIRRSRKSDHHM